MIRTSFQKRWRRMFYRVPWSFLGVVILMSPLSLSAATDSAKADNDAISTVVGSAQRYETTTSRLREGELSAEDFHQASLLGSRVLTHLNSALGNLDYQQLDAARADLDKSRTLFEIIRELLPTTTVTTVVKDAAGQVVYRHVDHVQDDKIPLFESSIDVEIIEPVTEAQNRESKVGGLKLADARRLYTSALLDLSYVDRKIASALAHLDEETDEAAAELLLAQINGVEFVVNEEDDPLVDAQATLRTAERMVEQEEFEAARTNLKLAKTHLAIYRGLLSKEEGEKVRDLEARISRLEDDVEGETAAATIRGFWDEVTGWFNREPGEARKSSEE